VTIDPINTPPPVDPATQAVSDARAAVDKVDDPSLKDTIAIGLDTLAAEAAATQNQSEDHEAARAAALAAQQAAEIALGRFTDLGQQLLRLLTDEQRALPQAQLFQQLVQERVSGA
jgi:hypothetical protein